MASATETATVTDEPAPAKLNLFLHVGRRRPDGYHDIDSLVVFTAFGDRVRLMPADALSLERTGPRAGDVPATREDDLCVRAAQALGHAVGRDPAFRITLEKNIPVAAGLGGGSADAAAVVRALCRIWGEDPGSPAVSRVAAALGADVPVCLAGRPARVSGIGERVVPLSGAAALWVLLVNPGVPLSTADVFGAYRPGDGMAAAPAELDVSSANDVAGAMRRLRNDLDAPARACCPPVAEIIDALDAVPGCLLARMSGSGPSCWALFDDAQACAGAKAAVRAKHPGWWTVGTRTLT